MHKAEELIRSSDLSFPISKDALIAALIPRIGFTSYPWIPRALPLGTSRFGGPADLPDGVDWPRVKGRPLLLMTQLNFGNLPIERTHPVLQQLPKHGWLCLFLDMAGYAAGLANEEPGVVALQFEGTADKLIRHDPEPTPNIETWTHCHALTEFPAHHLCLPAPDAVDSPLPQGTPEEIRNTYDALTYEIDKLAQTRHEVRLLGSPTLYNPDLRRSLHKPNEWMLLLQFDGDCSWLAGASSANSKYLHRPSFGDADFVQYFVRKADYEAGRLDRGFLDYMQT